MAGVPLLCCWLVCLCCVVLFAPVVLVAASPVLSWSHVLPLLLGGRFALVVVVAVLTLLFWALALAVRHCFAIVGLVAA